MTKKDRPSLNADIKKCRNLPLGEHSTDRLYCTCIKWHNPGKKCNLAPLNFAH